MPSVIDPEGVKSERVTLTEFVHDPAISLVLKAITLLFNNNVYEIASLIGYHLCRTHVNNAKGMPWGSLSPYFLKKA